MRVGETWEGYRAAHRNYVAEVRRVLDFTDKQVTYEIRYEDDPTAGTCVKWENEPRTVSRKRWDAWVRGATLLLR